MYIFWHFCLKTDKQLAIVKIVADLFLPLIDYFISYYFCSVKE